MTGSQQSEDGASTEPRRGRRKLILGISCLTVVCLAGSVVAYFSGLGPFGAARDVKPRRAQTITHHLVMRDRERVGRDASPSAVVIDSQSVKTTEAGGPMSRHRRCSPISMLALTGFRSRSAASPGSGVREGLRADHRLGNRLHLRRQSEESLVAPDHRISFAKLQCRIEVDRPADAVLVTAAMPRIVDMAETYLRAVRPEELRSDTGAYLLREALMNRFTVAVPGAAISDVLFEELLVQ